MVDHPIVTLPNHTQLEALCQQYAIRKVSLFGSVLREDFRPDSDVDVLIEFEDGARIGWEFIDIQDALSTLIGYEIDLHTPQSLGKYIRQRILRTAQVIYERKR